MLLRLLDIFCLKTIRTFVVFDSFMIVRCCPRKEGLMLWSVAGGRVLHLPLLYETVSNTNTRTFVTMDQKLAQLRTINQKDKAQKCILLLDQALSQSDPASVTRDVHKIIEAALTQDHIGPVPARQVLSELVNRLGEGRVKDRDAKKQIVEDTIAIAQPRIVSFEEQVSACLV